MGGHKRHAQKEPGEARGRHHNAQTAQPFGQDARLVALHRSRCWDWTPSAVVALAACPQAPLMAVGLESGDLELWDLNFMVCLQTIVGFGVEITALAWAKDSLDGSWRTFAAALDGSLAEVSWKQARLVSTTDSGAGAVWSLAAQPASAIRPGFDHQIAAGCDDGSVRLFSVEGGEPGLNYERTLAHLKGRVLGLSWHPSGNALVAGGADGCIHGLDPNTGHETMRITAGASTSQPVCVWRLLVLPDGTIVSGDSGGAVQFWDGRFGTLLQRFASHKADILALAASPSGRHVWASGIDSQVAMFELSGGADGRGGVAGAGGAAGQSGGGGGSGNLQCGGVRQWVYTHHKRPHTHDVRALEVVRHVQGGVESGLLISGGADAQLIVYPCSSSFLQVHPARLTKTPQRPLCSLALGATTQLGATQRVPQTKGAAAAAARRPPPSRVLCASQDTLDVWQVGCITPPSATGGAAGAVDGQAVDLNAAPRHLARILTGGGRVAAACLAPGGQFAAVAAGSDWAVRVYRLADSGNQGGVAAWEAAPLSVKRLPVAAAGVANATALCVSDRHVFVAQSSGKVCVLQLPEAGQQQGSGAGQEEEEREEVTVVAQASAWDATSVASSSNPGGGNSQQWCEYLPVINRLCISPDGTVLAAAGRNHVTFLRLTQQTTPPAAAGGAAGGAAAAAAQGAAAGAQGAGSKAQWSLQRVGAPVQLHRAAPVTAMSFSPDGSQLALTTGDAHLLVLDVAGRRPTAWSVQHEEPVADCLRRLPGSLIGVAWAGGAGGGAESAGQVLVYSPGGFCSLDMTRPVGADVGVVVKRQRGWQKPDDGVQKVAGAGPVVDQAVGGRQGARCGALKPADGNGRVVLLPDPVAFVGYLGPQEVLLLEKPWEDVLAGMPPPMYRRRYE